MVLLLLLHVNILGIFWSKRFDKKLLPDFFRYAPGPLQKGAKADVWRRLIVLACADEFEEGVVLLAEAEGDNTSVK